MSERKTRFSDAEVKAICEQCTDIIEELSSYLTTTYSRDAAGKLLNNILLIKSDRRLPLVPDNLTPPPIPDSKLEPIKILSVTTGQIPADGAMERINVIYAVCEDGTLWMAAPGIHDWQPITPPGRPINQDQGSGD